MLAAALLATLAASPSVGTKGLSTFGVKPEVGEFFTATLQKELHERGIELVIRPEADAAGKVALCADGKPCALIVRGTIAQLGDKTRLELELVGSDGKRVARHSAIAADPASLADQVPPLAEQLAAEINGAAPAQVTEQPVEKVEKPVEKPPEVKPAPAQATATPEPAAPTAKPRLWWIPLLGTVVLAGAAGGCFAVAQGDHSTLTSGGHLLMPLYSYADGQAIADHGRLFDTLGWVSLSLAAAAAITAVALWYFTGSAQ